MFAEPLIRFFVGKVKSLIHEGFLRLFFLLQVLLLVVFRVFKECEQLSFPQFLTLTPTWHLLPVLLDPTSLINPGPNTYIVTSYCLLSTLRRPGTLHHSVVRMRWGHSQPHFLHWLIFPAKILECSTGHWYCTVPLSARYPNREFAEPKTQW